MSFAVYRSSAGSGKTYTLVKEYLGLVLSEPANYSRILAITFTNKVANEMKERVLRNLKELSGPPENRSKPVNKNLLPSLVKETGLTEAVISQRASEALEMILHNYSDFAVSTIDSFFHRIIRTFAFDFGLPVNFNVEMDTDDLIESVVNLLLDRVGDEPDLTRLLVDFLESKMEEDKGWNIERILKDFARTLFDEESSRYLGRIRSLSLSDFNRIARECFAKVRQYDMKITGIAKQALKLINSRNISPKAFYQGEKGLYGFFQKAALGNFDGLDSRYASDTVNNDKWTSAKATAAETDAILSVKENLASFYNAIGEIRNHDERNITLLRLLTGTIYPLAVLNELDHLLGEFKKENNLVHISEFNRRIHGIIQNEPVPFIYERLGDRFSHILIDEFQDTSVLQWTNLMPLVENSLSTGNSSLIVGDAKQAVYRWRNGDATQFTALPSIPGSDRSRLLNDREKLLTGHFKSFELNTNHRSGKEIVEFNNSFFASLVPLLGAEGQKVYEKLGQTPAAGKTGGYIHVEFSEEGLSTEQYTDGTVRRIIEIIGDLENDQFRRQDIAILCRSNREASIISSVLLETGIDVISAESLLLQNSPEVVFITGLVSLLYNTPDELLAAGLITYLYRHRAFGSTGIRLHELLSDLKTIRLTPLSFFEFIHSKGKDLPQLSVSSLLLLPVFDLCEELIRTFSLQTKPDPFLQFFLDAVLKFSRKISSAPSDFLEWWEDHKTDLSVIVPEGMNAVHVMTIHKAKGLQFPAVILPFAHQRKKISRSWFWVDLEGHEPLELNAALIRPNQDLRKTAFGEMYDTEDERSMIDLVNLLYVAMTRPEDRLYVLSKNPGKQGIGSIPGLFVHFLSGQGQWSEDKLDYEFGKKEKNKFQDNESGSGIVKLDSFISNTWQDKIVIRRRAPVTWDMDDPQNKTRWGNLVHSVLAGINTEVDIPVALDNAVDSGLLDPGEHEELEKMIRTIINHEKIKPFFSEKNKIKTEAEILLPDGKVYRPDRVIIDGNKATVIDYKTGFPKENHRQQVNDYERYLKDMGYGNIRKYLVYLDPVTEVIEIE